MWQTFPFLAVYSQEGVAPSASAGGGIKQVGRTPAVCGASSVQELIVTI